MKILLTALLASYMSFPLDWTVGYSSSKDIEPEVFYESTVPGAAQLDIASALGYPDYNVSDNYKMFGWMEDVFFVYRATFAKPDYSKNERVWFCSKGIDYEFDIRLNGKELLHQEGMLTPVELDITDYLMKENQLEVVIYKAPKCHASPEDRTQARYSAKPPVSYGWDWHPRLIPSGIWDETAVQVRNVSYIRSHDVSYKLTGDFSRADITISASVAEPEMKSVDWVLYDRNKNVVASASSPAGQDMAVSLEAPELWWCHDHGEPYLYEYVLSLKDRRGNVIQTDTGKIGFRRVRLVMNEGAWDEPRNYPMTRSNPPAQFELNGKRIFAKGTNWLAPDIFIGTIKPETYDTLLNYALHANFNVLRCWGGCAPGKDSFFDLCDEKGILVWQEFPLSCNDYPDDPHYLQVLEKEAKSLVKRLRMHPCIAMWCGGNELFNSWSGMTDQSLALRMLNSVCLEFAPDVPFNYTSPLMGMGHGCYLFRFKGAEVFEWMNNAHFTAYTEFGMPGASPVDVLKKIIPENDLYPARPGTAWEDHHAFNSWATENTWHDEPTIDYYYGESSDLEELVFKSQLLQCEGYKCIYEEARRQKPYCAMALNWCYNEPWPAAVNNSLLVWPATPKPALNAVRASCRPICASARFDHYQWTSGETFECQLWLLNDAYGTDYDKLTVKAYIKDDNGDKITLLSTEGIAEWTVADLKDNTNAEGPMVSAVLPASSSRTFEVCVEVEGHPELNSSYVMSRK